MLALPQQVKYLHKECLNDRRVRLALGKISAESVLKDDLVYAAFAQCFSVGNTIPRDREAFEAFLLSRKGELAAIAQQLDTALCQAALSWQSIQGVLSQLSAKDAELTVQDMQSQLAHLFYAGFIRQTPVTQLMQYPRYLEAVLKRIDKMRGQVARDKQMTVQIQRYWKPVSILLDQHPLLTWTPARQSLRWLLEEWRISLFAQPMKTRVPASEKRVEEAWQLAAFPSR